MSYTLGPRPAATNEIRKFKQEASDEKSIKGRALLTADERETFIAVMGMAGRGKSSFIKALTENEEIIIGHDHTSCQYLILSL